MSKHRVTTYTCDHCGGSCGTGSDGRELGSGPSGGYAHDTWHVCSKACLRALVATPEWQTKAAGYFLPDTPPAPAPQPGGLHYRDGARQP